MALDLIEKIWSRFQSGEFGEDRFHAVSLAQTHGELLPSEHQGVTELIHAGKLVFRNSDEEIFYEFEYKNGKNEFIIHKIHSEKYPPEFARNYIQTADFEAVKAKHRQSDFLANNRLYAEEIHSKK